MEDLHAFFGSQSKSLRNDQQVESVGPSLSGLAKRQGEHIYHPEEALDARDLTGLWELMSGHRNSTRLGSVGWLEQGSIARDAAL